MVKRLRLVCAPWGVGGGNGDLTGTVRHSPLRSVYFQRSKMKSIMALDAWQCIDNAPHAGAITGIKFIFTCAILGPSCDFPTYPSWMEFELLRVHVECLATPGWCQDGVALAIDRSVCVL